MVGSGAMAGNVAAPVASKGAGGGTMVAPVATLGAMAACSPLPRLGGAVVARAPLRVSFGGGGTDLAPYYERFGGLVVSAALARNCTVVATPTPDGSVRIKSADYGISQSFRRGEVVSVAEPLALPRAAVERFWRNGLAERGVELRLASQAPPGSGLGGSSAMAVALVRALAAYTHTPLDPGRAAGLACWLEIERLGLPIGKQDQCASAFGGLNAITFAREGVDVTPLVLPAGALATLKARLLLFWTGRTHDSAAILRQQRAPTSANGAVTESLHRLKALAAAMRNALVTGDLDAFGRLLDRAWQQKRGLSPHISSAAIDGWYAAARAAGALGGKIAGAGGGGYLLLYCPPLRQAAVRGALSALGLREMPCRFDLEGAEVATA
jgi:D-glycero-alpha-D-manno-heptose-7-phosphate kinase